MRVTENFTLDKLPCARSASWDPNVVCLSGARATNDHARDGRLTGHEANSTILWLSGVAESGKTAIAHTVPQRLHQNDLLGSSFFFDHDSTQMLCTTIARDLADAFPAIAEYIPAALESELGRASTPLARQFEESILKPLRRYPIDRSFAVAIDALDESIRDKLDNSFPIYFVMKPASFLDYSASSSHRIQRPRSHHIFPAQPTFHHKQWTSTPAKTGRTSHHL